ncbi:MAG TPA: DNA-binding protein Alba [Methanomassiliicoccales archaeon]|nr:DNA-binding protein Alba [Methanomassiliicoccales archaeon]
MDDEHIIYIGKKPTMNYVLAVVYQLNSGIPNVTVKARGRAISKAVDVALIVKDRFVQNSEIQSITINTEVLENSDGQPTKVSSIEIPLIRS